MARYRIGPAPSKGHADIDGDYYPDGEVRGDTVYDNGDWSEDTPTGIFTSGGDMIYRTAARIGFDLSERTHCPNLLSRHTR